jgi:predicted double-glycine peptidase
MRMIQVMSVVSAYLKPIRDISEAEVLLNVPSIRQSTEYSCGAATFESIMAFYGNDLSEENVMDILKTTEGGTSPESFLKGAKKFGLKSKMEKGMSMEEIRDYLDKKIPVILAIQAWNEKKVDYAKDWGDGHYVAAIGYDKDGFYFMDPSQLGYSYLETEELDSRWHDISKEKEIFTHLGIVIYGKSPEFDIDKIRKIK